jgi:uncharacterized protein YaiI (UPF0178 family)
MRNFMQKIRDYGEQTGGPSPLNKKDAHCFANTLDRFLNDHLQG